MLYRLKFDGYVGGILKRCGFNTSASLDFWPTGATADWVKRGKRKSWKPIEAAALGISQIAAERVEARQLSLVEAQFVVTTAEEIARENGARDEVLEHLALVIWKVIPGAAKEN